MSLISFSLDQHNLPVFQVEDPEYRSLGAWLILDISVYYDVCLDALADVDDVGHGQPIDQWDSEHFDVTINAAGITFVNYHVDESGSYSLADFRDALENYWRFLVSRPETPGIVRQYWPDLPLWQADLLQWEQRNGRPHPYRGRLF
ncbi:hypothetical protein [Asanoa sp. NPDC050611]|uniref:hypothetical protein n=1 Tax=Asanoa sp. NPDC050611 TaxID=3157098 RepID=UPI0034050CE8